MTTVVIPQPIRADVDADPEDEPILIFEAPFDVGPDGFASSTGAPLVEIDPEHWRYGGGSLRTTHAGTDGLADVVASVDLDPSTDYRMSVWSYQSQDDTMRVRLDDPDGSSIVGGPVVGAAKTEVDVWVEHVIDFTTTATGTVVDLAFEVGELANSVMWWEDCTVVEPAPTDLPHVFAEVTDAAMTRVEWNDSGELEVDFDAELTQEQVNEVIRIARDQPMLFDPEGPPIPPPLIPGEGWDYMGPIAPENIVTGTLQSRVQIGQELWVTRYADPTDPDSGPDPDSGIVSITPDDGLRLRIPNQDDPDAEPTTIVHLPTTLYDSSGERVSAIFRGRADFSTATAQQLRAIGRAVDGEVSSIATGAELQLNNAVADPASTPNVTFGPLTRQWSNTPADYAEKGWGVSGDTVVFAVRHTGKGGRTRFRFIDPVNGWLDHDVFAQTLPYTIGGLCVCGNYIYMLSRGVNNTWAIIRYNLNGVISGDGVMVTGYVNGPWQACLGVVEGKPTLVYRDDDNRIRLRQYETGADGLSRPAIAWGTDHYDTAARPLAGLTQHSDGSAYLFSGSRVVQLDNDVSAANTAGSFWSRIGNVAGGGLLPDGRLGAFDGQGTAAAYNDDPAVHTEFTASFVTTLANTVSGRETGMSPPDTRVWPAKSFATVQADRLEPGTDQHRYYGSTTGESAADMIRLGTSGAAAVVGPLARIPATGEQPPSSSQFTSAGEIPARIVSQARIPGSTRRAVDIDAQGNAELYGLTLPFLARHRSTNVSVPHGAQTTVAMNALTEADPTGCLTYSGGVFYVGWPGRYRIEAQLSWMSGGGYRTVILHVNNNPIANSFSAAGNYTSCVVAKTLRLAAGDQVTISGYQNSGGGLDVRGSAEANLSYLSIERSAA